MKASEKKWLSQHSAHDYTLLMKRWKKLAKKAGLEIVSLCQQEKLETIAVRGSGGGDREGLYLSAGVHGDEPAAVWGLLEWAEANQKILSGEAITILPCVNPWGFTNNVRMDFRGRDLNRLFHTRSMPFFRAWRKLMGDQQFRMAMNLHEDYDAQGIYVYELVPRGMNISDQVFPAGKEKRSPVLLFSPVFSNASSAACSHEPNADSTTFSPTLSFPHKACNSFSCIPSKPPLLSTITTSPSRLSSFKRSTIESAPDS